MGGHLRELVGNVAALVGEDRPSFGVNESEWPDVLRRFCNIYKDFIWRDPELLLSTLRLCSCFGLRNECLGLLAPVGERYLYQVQLAKPAGSYRDATDKASDLRHSWPRDPGQMQRALANAAWLACDGDLTLLPPIFVEGDWLGDRTLDEIVTDWKTQRDLTRELQTALDDGDWRAAAELAGELGGRGEARGYADSNRGVGIALESPEPFFRERLRKFALWGQIFAMPIGDSLASRQRYFRAHVYAQDVADKDEGRSPDLFTSEVKFALTRAVFRRFTEGGSSYCLPSESNRIDRFTVRYQVGLLKLEVRWGNPESTLHQMHRFIRNLGLQPGELMTEQLASRYKVVAEPLLDIFRATGERRFADTLLAFLNGERAKLSLYNDSPETNAARQSICSALLATTTELLAHSGASALGPLLGRASEQLDWAGSFPIDGSASSRMLAFQRFLTFAAVIEAHERSGDPEEAKRFAKEMWREYRTTPGGVIGNAENYISDHLPRQMVTDQVIEYGRFLSTACGRAIRQGSWRSAFWFGGNAFEIFSFVENRLHTSTLSESDRCSIAAMKALSLSLQALAYSAFGARTGNPTRALLMKQAKKIARTLPGGERARGVREPMELIELLNSQIRDLGHTTET
jgi:hypothetical protein